MQVAVRTTWASLGGESLGVRRDGFPTGGPPLGKSLPCGIRPAYLFVSKIPVRYEKSNNNSSNLWRFRRGVILVAGHHGISLSHRPLVVFLCVSDLHSVAKWQGAGWFSGQFGVMSGRAVVRNVPVGHGLTCPFLNPSGSSWQVKIKWGRNSRTEERAPRIRRSVLGFSRSFSRNRCDFVRTAEGRGSWEFEFSGLSKKGHSKRHYVTCNGRERA